ncbi:TetR/AcrR family transcriptional regulator [Blastococcus sp. SYSU D00669]
MAVRVSRVEQAAANHAAVLAAARRVFLRAGYHGATVDAVAAEAGFTIGAVYSRFRGKAELFLALLEERVTERIEQLRAVRPEAPPPRDRAEAARLLQEDVLAVARQWAGILRTDLDWTLLVVEFRVHAARDPHLAARFAEQHARLLTATADVVGDLLGGPAVVDRRVAEDIARAGLALGPGIALARAAEGEAFRDELVEELHVALATRLSGAPGPDAPPSPRRSR